MLFREFRPATSRKAMKYHDDVLPTFGRMAGHLGAHTLAHTVVSFHEQVQ